MPVFRKDVNFFFDKFIKVSTNNDEDGSVWAVGSHKGTYLLTVIEKKIDDLTKNDIANKLVFVTITDLMKFSPYWKYDEKALEQAKELARSYS